MQGLRLKFGERRNDWKCCFCCHVRTGTIFLGIWHLMIHILVLLVMALMLHNPDVLEKEMDPILPTPLSETDNENFLQNMGIHINNDRQPPMSNSYKEMFGHRAWSRQDMNFGFLFTICTFAMTLMLVYGAVKGKPSYLMPFFCLQVFDFCITSLTAVGYLCYLPDLSRSIVKSSQFPYKEEVLKLNPQTLVLGLILVFLIAMTIKAYFIGVVWSCYKYLTLRQVAAQRTIQFIDPDIQNLIPDLPDYETAVKKFPTPPPSYASAMQGHYPVVGEGAGVASNSVSPAPIAQVPQIVVPAVPTQQTGAATNPPQHV